MALTPATQNQVPSNSILDAFNRQVYLGNSFVFSNQLTIGGTSETPIMLLSNPASNGIGNVSPLGLFFNLRKLTCLTAAHTALFNFYANPTVTGAGTPGTPVNFRTASATTSKMTIATNPSVSANGKLMAHLMSANQTSNVSQVLVILDPGQTMLCTVTVSNANDVIATEFGWFEL